MSGFTHNLSNLPPGCSDSEIEAQCGEDEISEDQLQDARQEIIYLVQWLGKGTELLNKAIREFQEGHSYNASVAAKAAGIAFNGVDKSAQIISATAFQWSEFIKEKL